MEQLQQQILSWCHDLEDYLECAQCNRTLVQDIYLCEAGHFVCLACSQSSPNNKCSICKMKYTKTRNYLAEDLAGKMETIKRQIGGNVENDDDDWRSVCSEVGNATWNTFSCWIGKCKTQGTIEEIRQHCKASHSGCYVRHCDDKLPHSTSFFLNYSFPRTMDRLLDIPNVGLFILHIVVYDNGALRAHLLMYESGKNAKKYQYKLKIQCNDQNSSVEGVVDTIRIPKNILPKRGMFLQRAHNLQLELQNTLKFTCFIELDRNNRPPEEKPAQNARSGAKYRARNQRLNDNQTDSNANAISQNSSDANKFQKNSLKKLITENDQNSQEKPKNPAPKKANFQKKQNAGVKSETVKKSVENQTPEVKDNQSKVNNPRQASGVKSLPTVASIPPFTANHQLNPMMSYTGSTIAASPGVVYPAGGLSPQGFQSNTQRIGAPPGVFPGANPYYYPAPGTPGIPGALLGQPSAPVEDCTGGYTQYPDLTKMKHKMIDDFSRTPVIERGRTKGGKLSAEKDKCLIS